MPGVDERSDVKPEMAIFKCRGLKGRVEEADIQSLDDILAYTENYEDLLFLKNLVLYYLDRIKQTNVSEKNLEIFTEVINKINKKIKKVIALSLYNTVGLFED